MKKINWIFLLAIVACGTEEKGAVIEEPPKETQTEEVVELEKKEEWQDFSFQSMDVELPKKENADALTIGIYTPLYVGTETENIPLSYAVVSYQDWKPDPSTFKGHENYKGNNIETVSSTDDLNIHVQTSTEIIGYNTKFQTITSYPVIIKNTSDKDLLLAYQPFIENLSYEAKDKDGNWKVIQKSAQPVDAHLSPIIRLNKGEHVVTNCPVFEGGFKTSLRMAYKTGYNADTDSYKTIIYSNEFEGNINESQFEGNFDALNADYLGL